MPQNVVELALRLAAGRFRAEARAARAEFARTLKGMRSDSRRLKDAFAVLDVRPVREVSREIDRLRAAYNRLARDGGTSSRDLARAQAALKRRIRELRAEIRGTQGAFAALRGVLPAAGVAGGVLALGEGIRNVTRAGIEMQRIMSTLRFGTGSLDRARQAFAFVSAEAERLGLNVRRAAKDYATLTAATRGTALEGEQTREIFKAIGEASAVMGLSAEDASGALRAIVQIASKGTVQAEELRGQLGERIPGAFQIAARAMGVTESALNGMLERGEVFASDFLPRFAAQLRKELGGNVSAAAKTAQAEINRFRNAVFRLEQAIASGGVLSGITRLVGLLTRLADLEGQNIQGLKLLFLGPQNPSVRIDQEIEKIDERLRLLKDELARPGLLRIRTGFAIEPVLNQEIAQLEAQRKRLLDAQSRFLFGGGAQQNQAQQKRAEIANKIKNAEQRLAEQRKQLAEAAAKREIELRKEVLRETISASKAAIRTKQAEVNRLIAEEQRWAERRKQIQAEIAGIAASTEARIRDLRRRDMTEAQQQADIESEVADKIRAARQAILEGRDQEAQRLAGRIDTLAGQLQDTDKAVAVLQELQRIRTALKQAELAAGDRESQARRKQIAEAQQQIRHARGLIEQLTASLKALEDEDPTIEIRDNIDKELARIAKLKAALAEVNGAGATATARTGFAHGGRLPGYGGGDRIPALLESGEFVIRKEAVRRYGAGLFEALNAMRLQLRSSGGRIPEVPTLPRLAAGGPAPAPAGDTVHLKLDFGSRTSSLFGERDQVRAFVDALSEIARGG